MPIKIQGLPGLNRLSESERQQFMLNNEDRLRKYASDPMAQKRAAEILYDNMMFKNKLGSDLFNQLKAQGIGRDQRNEILRQSIIDEVAQRYNPIGKNGFRDNSKGLGENWEKFNQMSLDGKQKLLESEWKTPDELNTSLAEESKTKGIGDILGDAWNRLSFGAVKGLSNLDFKEAITSLPKDLWGEVSAVLGMSSDIIGNIPKWFSSDDKVAATIGVLGGKEGAKQYLKMKNDKIFQNIYNDEADGSAERLGPQVSSEYMSQASKNLSDNQVKAAFIKAITPGSYVDEYGNPNRGVPMYAAYYRDGKDIEDEMKNFSIDEMRQFLAKKAAYDKYLSPEMAATALNNEAQRYIKKNQDSLTRFGLWAKDVGIASLSYSADKVNGLYNLYLLGKDRLADGVDTGLGRVQLGERPTVYMDDRGRVLSPSKTKFYNGSDGKLYYDDENGKAHAVHRQQISNAALHNMGKNSEGEDLSDLWGTDWMTLDPTYWTKAEQFGTLDENELKQWEKLGASPYKVAYDPNEESSLWYEAFKMMSFGLADGAAMAIPFGIGMAGRALSTASQTGKVLGGIGKVLDGIGKGLTYQTTLGSTVQGSLGALGIAYAYERNAFQETLEKNLLDAEDTLLNRSRSLVFAKYQNDGNYKRNVDALIEKEKGSLGDYRKQLKANGYSDKAIDSAINARAQESVFNKLIQQDLNAARESQEYSNLQQQAINAASKAANISFLPEAIKYGIVNTVGYRKYLYTNPAGLKRKVSAALKGLQEVDKDGKKRLAVEGSKFGTRGQKMKEFSKIVGKQMWGGAWTNGTDDMMVDAAERISADQYNMYLNDFLTGSSLADTYGFADGLFSYINGLQNSLGQGTTWNAALVGGMGSVLSATPNMANIAHLMTKEGRNEYKNKFTRRPVRNENGEIVRNQFGEPVTEGIRWRDNPVERLSYFIQNGVLNSYYGAMQQERDLENHAMYVNDLLDQYEDFKMIEDVLSSDRHLEHADDEGTKKTMRFIKAIKANQLLDTLGERADDPTGLSSVIMRMKDLTERVANLEDNENSENPLSEEEIAEQIAQYYKANNVPQNEQNNEEALKVIVKNAKELMEANKAYRDALEDINQIEQETGKTIPNSVKNKMMMVHALSKHWRERASQMMSEIGDIHSVNDIDADSDISNEDLLASVGGKAGANALSRVYERQTQEIEKAIEEAKEEVGKKEKALKDAEEKLKKRAAEESSNLNQEIFDQAADLAGKRAELEDAKQKQKYLEDILFESNKHKGSINEALEEGKDKKNKTLTADEIFNLDVKTRARMLDKRNRNLYSIAQRREIEKLEKRIINEQGEGALQKIQDIALLANRIKMSEDAYSRMANNPAAADVHLESQRSAAAAEAHKLIDKRNARILAEYIGEAYDALKRRSDVSEEFLKDFVYRTLRKFNTSILDAIDDEAFLPIFQQEIDDARTWSKTLADITAVIDNIDGTEEWRNMMLHNVDKIVSQASNKEEIMHSLEEAIDSLRESKEPMGKRAADDIEKLLVGMKRIGYQRDSAVIESREERKKREKEQDDRNKAAEEKLKTEEKKATKKPKNTESVDEGTVDMKAAEDVNFGEDDEIEEKKGPKEEGTTHPAGPFTPKTEKVTPETVQDHIQITNTSNGMSYIFPVEGWNKSATADVRTSADGWGTNKGFTYYKKSISGRGGDNITIWFKEEPSEDVKRQMELFLEKGKRLDDTETLAKILNGEKVYALEKVTPENLHEHIQISSTSLEGGGEHVIFNTSEWSKYAVPIRENGWGKQDGHVYYTRNFVPETGRNVVTVWFKEPPSQAIREQIELFVDFSHRLLGKMPLNSPDTLAKILNGEKVFEEEGTPKENLRVEGAEILKSLGYKMQDRHSNGHVRGGQSGWKVRFVVKNPKTGKAFTEDEVDADKEAYYKAAAPILEYLKEYFKNPDGTDKIEIQKPQGYGAGHYGYTDKDGKWREPFKFLTGGEVGEADFTIYIGSRDDVDKFIADAKASSVYDLIAAGENKSDVSFSDKIHGRIEGRSIGFSGYALPDGLEKKVPGGSTVYEDDVVSIITDDINGGYAVEDKQTGKLYGYSPNSSRTFSDAVNYVNDNILKIRNKIAENVYGEYITGTQGEQPAGESNPPIETNEDFVAESSSLEEQQKEAQQSSDNVKIVPTDSLESMEPSNASNIPPSGGGKKKKGVERDANLSGNRFAEWESLPLQGDKEKRIPKGRLIHKKGSKEGDHMNTFYNWLKLTGTKLQNIIDRELHQIMAVTPGHKVKVKFMLSRRDNGVLATGNDKIPSVTRVGMKNNLLLVVDYTPEVAKVHDEKNGGVFESNGKKYLLIGVAGGYDGTDQNSIRKKSYDIINSGGGGLASKGMKAFFDEHGNELYFVNDDVHTEIVESYPLPGWVVKALEGEPATGVLRNISDLLNDEKRNPYGLTLKSLPWAIVTRQSTIIVNNRDGKAVMKPNKEDTETGDEINVGNTFALIPASNGKLMPLMIQPRRLNEIRDGALKRNIYKAFEQLISKNREERLEAASKLEKYLYLNRQNGISIRVPKGNTIYFNRGQRTVATINITDSTTIQDVINIMENSNMNPRINITAGVLNDASSSNPALFKQYEEAGAFMLDAATLSTAGSSFMIYSLSEDGEIVRTPGSVNRNPAASSRGTTVKYKGDSYTEIEGSYYKVPEQASAEEIVDKELVTDPATINAIRYNFRIERGELRAEVTKGDWNYYIVNAGENPKVIRVDPSHAVEELSKEQSADFIKERQEAKEAAEREEKARKQLEKIEKNKKMEYREFHDEESGDDIRVVLDTDNSRLLFRNPDGSVWDYVYAQEFLDEVGFEGILRRLYGDDVNIANSSYETFTSKEYTGMKQTNEDAPIVLDDNTDSFIPDGKTIVPVGEMEVIDFGDEDTGPAETSKGDGSTEETVETKESKKEGTIEDEKYVDVIEEELKRKKKATQTFEELYATHSRAIDEVVLDKWPDAPEDPTELKNFLKEKGITEIESIGTTQKDIDAFIRTIECVQK